jgi:alkyl hydroperoxide reductase subunit AhpC
VRQFNDKAKDFADANCQVIGCSGDSAFVHQRWTMLAPDQGGLGPMEIPLIADVDRSLARDYGCLIEDDSGDRYAPFRATYIIDKEGVLRHYSMNDLPIGRNADEVLRLVKALAFADEHGEVCPASWQPGQPTMVPSHDSQKTKDFWSNVYAKK